MALLRSGLVSVFSRLAVDTGGNRVSTRCISTNVNPLLFRATACLYKLLDGRFAGGVPASSAECQLRSLEQVFVRVSVTITDTLTNTCSRDLSWHSADDAGTPPAKRPSRSLLSAEPLKKKKRIDPAIIKHREERKKKRIEKQIRRLERNARQLKPIDELEIPLPLLDHKKERERKLPPLTPEEEEERALLQKEWSRYKYRQHVKDVQMIDRLVFAQQKALDELRKESEELYQAAIQISPWQIPFTARGPVRTPPIKDYESPDGEYVDVSKKW